MRKEIKDVAVYKAAKEALRNLITTFQKEILPITYAWKERGDKVYTNIGWYNPEYHEEMGSFYGTTRGLYILSEVGEYFIWLPKTTKAYSIFHDAMTELYHEDDNFFINSIPEEIGLFFDGDRTVNFKFSAYVSDVTDETELTSAKTIAEELIEMLSDFKGCEACEFYEGDDEPDKEHIYHPGDELPANYFVGVKSKYDFYNVN